VLLLTLAGHLVLVGIGEQQLSTTGAPVATIPATSSRIGGATIYRVAPEAAP